MTDALPSVVVVSRDRHGPLRRTAEYYSSHGFETVLVDGSAASCADLVDRRGVTYVHAPTLSYYQRLSEGLERASGDAVLLAADDDVNCLPAVRECVRVLAADPGLVRACGTTVHVCQYRKSVDFAFADLPTERILELRPGVDRLDRFSDALTVWPQVFYAVTRTSVARSVAATLANLPPGADSLGEHLWVALPALAGRFALIPRLQLVRSIGRPNYAVNVSALAGLRTMRGWPPFEALAKRLAEYARHVGLDENQQEQVVELFDRYREAPTLGPLERSMSAVRRGLNWASYLRHPAALLDDRERGIVNGVRHRRLAKLGSYPWKCEVARAEFEAVLALLD